MASRRSLLLVSGLAVLACAAAFTTPTLSGLIQTRQTRSCAASSVKMSGDGMSRRASLGVAAGFLAGILSPPKVRHQPLLFTRHFSSFDYMYDGFKKKPTWVLSSAFLFLSHGLNLALTF
jgi:hypothetical protein